MANPTTYFGWVMPTATDLVTDLPADFDVFGQGVDTSMADLLGGTTGQVLSKTSGTDMDFTWINNDQGDITGVTAGTGISGGGTSGSVTVSIDTTVTVDKTTAQTLTNKTLTTPIISSISNTGTLTLPTSTDTLVGRATTDTLTNKTLTSPALTTPTISTLTTNGDLVYGTGSGALSRLGIGSSAQVLTVASGIPSWATPAGGGGLTLLQTNTLSGTSYTTGSIDQSYKQLQILLRNISSSGADSIFFRLNSDTGSNYYWGGLLIAQSAANAYYANEPGTSVLIAYENMSGTSRLNAVINLYRYTDTDEIFFDFGTTAASTSFTPDLGRMTLTGTGIYNNSAAITTMTILTGTGNVSGTMYVYGVS